MKTHNTSYTGKYPCSLAFMGVRPTMSVLSLLIFLFFGCTDFVEVDPPKNILVAETVFDQPATVESALANLYYDMREQGMVSGGTGLTTGLSIYADELEYYGNNADFSQIYLHGVHAGNNTVIGWWRQAYHIIYSANDIIKGVELSDSLTEEEKNRFKGQSLFVRAYIHSLLTQLFGNVPYITTTDYQENNQVSRMPEDQVMEHIIRDLEEASDLLSDFGGLSDERVLPDHYAVKALLARMYLYAENWEEADAKATELITAFRLEPDLDKVFLKGSPETIWQLKAGNSPRNTREAAQFIIQAIPGQDYALSENLMSNFEEGDQRWNHWVGSMSDTENSTTLYYPFKYKADLNEEESVEYSIVFRLAEQYLIRAEARLRSGDINGARSDLDAIRNRAGLADMAEAGENALMDAIVHERRIELFAERGHRWFDLKRTGKAGQIMPQAKANWKDTDLLFPIPESELETNPNLAPQNNGY